MGSNELIIICASAFAAVFLILTLLALLMRLITRLLPHLDTQSDHEMIAAISTAGQKNYPGFKVTKIEEIK